MNAPHRDAGFFTESLESRDPEIFAAIEKELGRQRDEIELIASENIVSAAVMAAQGSVMTNKYAEGYPGRRYYGGCEYVDIAENLAIDRAKALFGVRLRQRAAQFRQPGEPGRVPGAADPRRHDPGHEPRRGRAPDPRREAQPVGQVVQRHPVRRAPQDLQIDYDQIAELTAEHKPKMIIAGGSAIPRIIDFRPDARDRRHGGRLPAGGHGAFRGARGLGPYPSPFPHAHVATTTTHKTLRGPRGGMILTNDEALAKKVNSAIFPGIQGGPLMHVIAAKAVAFGEALRPGFKDYQAQVIANAQALADQLMKGGLDIVTGGTDTHLMLVDLRPKGVKGNATEKALGRAHITCNKNGIPFDTEKPTITSGVRLGSPAGTTRGFGEAEFRQIGDWIVEVVDGLAANGEDGNGATEAKVAAEVLELCRKFPVYPDL
jgi:glycine hydroxymethyltransferase